MSTYNITTPHAAVLIWNYDDRITVDGTKDPDKLSEPMIISTLSCRQIQTSKSKSQPNGTFSFVLAPNKNWVEAITPGSWCCILMSNIPITQDDLTSANSAQIKMIGKIESVRAEVQVMDNGARNTIFNVTGVDWGHVFNNVLYIDNLIASPNDPINQGNAAAVAIRRALFANNSGTPQSFAVKDNLNALMSIFGQSLDGFTKVGDDINRLAKSVYDYTIPAEMKSYFNFVDLDGEPTDSAKVSDILQLITGTLKDVDVYDDTPEALGFIDPFSLQGTNTFWQILLENSNPALNEMFPEMRWNSEGRPTLTLYNRIKPFSFKSTDYSKPTNVSSFFQRIKTHYIEDGRDIDPVDVMSINAGTNWRDKYNFVEIKPQFQDFNVIGNWYKQKCQLSDPTAFAREGFRPMIVGTKQFPFAGGKTLNVTDVTVDFDQLLTWAKLLKEWYFDTHRMLNGTIVLHGINNYIAVGDNIRFSAGFLNPTPNINASTVENGENKFILAHIESISHSFTVINEDTRSYVTTIQFVRGIIVDGENFLSGETLDQSASAIAAEQDKNVTNVFSSSDDSDPGPKVSGT